METKNIVVYVDDQPKFSTTLFKTTRVIDMKNYFNELYPKHTIRFFLNRTNNMVNVFDTNKYDNMDISSVWNQLDDGYVLLNSHSETTTLTGIKDVDFLILEKLTDKDLLSICSVNKYAEKLCSKELFWKSRFMKNISVERMQIELEAIKKILQKYPEESWKSLYYKHFILGKKAYVLDPSDLNQLKNVFTDVLDYLLITEHMYDEDRYMFSREFDSQQTLFESMSNQNRIGVSARSSKLAEYMLILLRLKVDKNGWIVSEDWFDGLYDKDIRKSHTVEELSKIWRGIEFKEYRSESLKKLGDVDIYDYTDIKKWLNEDFIKGNYYGIGAGDGGRYIESPNLSPR